MFYLQAFISQPNKRRLIGHAKASLIRYWKSVKVNMQSREFKLNYYASLINNDISKKVFISKNPDFVFMSHGIYADWGPAKDNAIKNIIPILVYSGSYLKNSLYFGIIRNLSDLAWGLKKLQRRKKIPFSKTKKGNGYIHERYFKNKCFDIKNPLTKKYNIQKITAKKFKQQFFPIKRGMQLVKYLALILKTS